MTIWCNSREEFVSLSNGALTDMQGIVEPAFLARSEIRGYCRGCGLQQMFDIGPPLLDPADWKNLREGLVCPCGFTARMRMTIRLLDELMETHDFASAAVLERATPMFAYLQARLPSLIGCEYVGASSPWGAMVDVNGLAVRNENMMALSFPDRSLDLLMHFDILEHVGDADAGLREAHRVLTDGGAMYFSCPFYHMLEENIVRAHLDANGDTVHLMPEIYHGNPISNRGALVFIHPSLELFGMLSDAGFSKVQAAVCYDPIEGIVSNGCHYPDGHMWPVAFVAWK